MATIFLGKIDRSLRNMEAYKWKWVMLGALGCVNNTDLKKIVNDILHIVSVFSTSLNRQNRNRLFPGMSEKCDSL